MRFLCSRRIGLPTRTGSIWTGASWRRPWSQAVPIDDFTQQEPVEGARPSRRTEVRIAYDKDRLYIGAILYDDPDGVIAYQKRRDAFLYTDDRFMWILDTFQDGRTGYFFETNPNGMRGDALLVGGSTSFFRSGAAPGTVFGTYARPVAPTDGPWKSASRSGR